ncbi:MAG TPA: universal stress protein [Thiolinea sp.]|nr:universal stress protein [Thiolinea sp.]
MSQVYVVGYDGSPSSRRALDFTLELAAESGGSIVLAHVLAWSPYSFLTQEELAERHVRRQEELERAESVVIKPVVEQLADKGITVDPVIRYGNIADTLCEIAGDKQAAQIIIGRTGDAGVVARIFGSVASALAQGAPIPCTIIP